MKKIFASFFAGALVCLTLGSINFPNGLDTLTNPTGGNSQAVVSHSAQHANANDILEALEAKVGTNNSSVATSIDYKFTQLFAATGTFGVSPAILSGAKTGFYSVPRKGAARAGTATTDQWDAANIGDYSNGFGYNCKASGNYSLAVGLSNTSSGSNSVAVGANSTSSGAYSFAAGNTATASGADSVAFMNGSSSSGIASFSMDGDSSGNFSVSFSGVASGDNSVAFPGSMARASYSFTKGVCIADKPGQFADAGGAISSQGDAQSSRFTLRGQTTDNVATEIFLDGGIAAGTSQLTLTNNTTWTFLMHIVARRAGTTGGNAGYKVEGVIHRDANAASTTLDVATKTVLYESDAAWDVTVTADTTNGSLKITVTGENAKTINWHAVVQTSEVSG